MIRLPAHSVTLLSYMCGILLAVYVAFVLATIYFASYKTELASELREREAAIVALETEYYAAVGKLTASDPATFGFVAPAQVRYVSAVGAPAFTRAD